MQLFLDDINLLFSICTKGCQEQPPKGCLVFRWDIANARGLLGHQGGSGYYSKIIWEERDRNPQNRATCHLATNGKYYPLCIDCWCQKEHCHNICVFLTTHYLIIINLFYGVCCLLLVKGSAFLEKTTSKGKKANMTSTKQIKIMLWIAIKNKFRSLSCTKIVIKSHSRSYLLS